MRQILFAVMLVCVTGCGTSVQRSARHAIALSQQADTKVIACVSAIYAKPQYESLAAHTPNIITGVHTMAQLTDETFISPFDIALFAARYDDTAPCREHYLQDIAAARPDLVPIIANGYASGSSLVVRLLKQQDTWAESARRSEALLNEQRQKIANANRQWGSDVMAAHQAEVAHDEAVAAMLMQFSAQQQIINAATRPQQTNCVRTGTFTNCTSY